MLLATLWALDIRILFLTPDHTRFYFLKVKLKSIVAI